VRHNKRALREISIVYGFINLFDGAVSFPSGVVAVVVNWFLLLAGAGWGRQNRRGRRTLLRARSPKGPISDENLL